MRALALGLALFALTACRSMETVPETGRRRPALRYSEREMSMLGANAYEELCSQYRVIEGTNDAALVAEVGEQIAAVTDRPYIWQFRLLEAPDIQNAVCLPGGKVAVFSGILPITEDRNGLAVVLSHEIAHATLEHGNERMSQPRLERLVGMPISIGANVWGGLAPGSRKLLMGAFGAGELVGKLMPYSQEHEREAHQVGLGYMGKADFELAAAPLFWKRMLAADPDQRPSDALHTHPDARQRAERLERLIAARNEAPGD